MNEVLEIKFSNVTNKKIPRVFLISFKLQGGFLCQK